MLSKIFLMIGHPDETPAYYDEVAEKLKWLAADEVRLSLITPFPGTELWNSIGEDGLLTTDYSKYTTFNPVLRMKHVSPDELIRQRKRILVAYYNSREFKDHAAEKVRKNPQLDRPFQELYARLKGKGLAA